MNDRVNDQTMSKPVQNTFLEDYEKALSLLLADHTRNFADDPQLFFETFFDRGQSRHQFWGILSSAVSADQTVVVTGGAGVGKTSFLYSIAYGPDRPSDLACLPIVADFRTAFPQSVEGCMTGFINNAQEQFAKAGITLEGLRENTVDNISQNVRSIHSQIKLLATTRSGMPRVFIFLDDFDYAEQLWFELLDYFLPFVQSAYCGVVLTVRPRLYAAIQSYDERLRFYFGRNVHEINLAPMPAREVLASRLAPILFERKSKSVLSSIIAQFRPKDRLAKIAASLGVKHLEDLPKIDFPFTERHNDFMHRITNGNLREIQAIATDSLLFVLQASDSLETRIEADMKRTVIGRENTLRLFYENPKAHFQIMNINKYRSQTGNSLLYNVLEALKIDPQVNSKLFSRLRSFGHREENVKWAIDYLADRGQRLLEAKWIMPKQRATTLLRSDEYDLTEKGHYYLDIAKWDEYRARAGDFGRSVLAVVQG